MRRPPYPARVAAGALVTTIDGTKQLPTRILTLPTHPYVTRADIDRGARVLGTLQ